MRYKFDFGIDEGNQYLRNFSFTIASSSLEEAKKTFLEYKTNYEQNNKSRIELYNIEEVE